MKININNTCILYFTTGNRGVKSFFSKKKKNGAVQQLLFSKTLFEIRKSKLDYQISDGKAFGSNFLNRLNGAVSRVFDSGYKNIIIVGDDTPELSNIQILKAHKNLTRRKVSIGPSKDGGAYLIAFQQSDFEQGILKNLTWHSAHFRDELVENVNALKLNYGELVELEDLNSAVDLHIYLNKNSYSAFFKILKNIFVSIQSDIRDVFSYSSEFYECSFTRGPPISF